MRVLANVKRWLFLGPNAGPSQEDAAALREELWGLIHERRDDVRAQYDNEAKRLGSPKPHERT